MPELNNAEDWVVHAQSQILADMENGVYPDGVEDEETSMVDTSSVYIALHT